MRHVGYLRRTQSSHQLPSRHVSLHSPLHSSGPTTPSIRNPPPEVLNGVVAHTKLTLTPILQKSHQERHVHVSPCYAKLLLHRS